MPKTKYPISREFFPYNKFTPPTSQAMIAQRVGYMKRMFWGSVET